MLSPKPAVIAILMYVSPVVLGLAVRGISAPTAQAQAQTQDQTPAQGATIQVRVRLVPVDVVVTNRLNRPVTDLRKEEFRIFENGRAQEIRHFAVQNFTDIAPELAPSSAPQSVVPAELTPQTARTFLILMGRGRHHRFKNMESLLRWLRTELLPRDRVAVFAYNRATGFTTNHGPSLQGWRSQVDERRRQGRDSGGSAD